MVSFMKQTLQLITKFIPMYMKHVFIYFSIVRIKDRSPEKFISVLNFFLVVNFCFNVFTGK